MIETFYLGVHHPYWLSQTATPLFVSHRALAPRCTLPRALGSWALDSGAFTELSLNGRWVTPPAAYVAAVRRYAAQVGSLAWAAPQDWMCEPFMLERTGLTVEEHQRRTVENYLALRTLAPELPFIPVLQGWALADYHRHVERYAAAGVDLATAPLVGLGSVCRRQSSEEIRAITETLAGLGLRLHGFGVKTGGLARYAEHLVSADSMAWSLDARRTDPLPGCPHKSCANCLRYAERWRTRIMRRLDRVQLSLRLAS